MREGIEISLLLALFIGLTAISPCQTRSRVPARILALDQPTAQSAPEKLPQAADSIVYSNYAYGFRLHLPKSWKGFTVIKRQWFGSMDATRAAESGPLLLIRHPLSTDQHPREDIPIMVITRRQWHAIKVSTLIVSAAPIPPTEIGRNQRYVFATPPRYWFDELEGFQEVVNIVNGKPLQPLRVTQVP
jgi:hypothetical protein